MPEQTLLVSTAYGEWEIPEEVHSQAIALSGSEFFHSPDSPGWQLVEQWVQSQPRMWIADMRHLASERV